MRVCVVGAGASGLCAARHLLAAGIQPLVLERASELGGTWVYTEATGYDSHGLPIHSSMYKSLHTNLPKEVMGFPDFPVPENKKSYVPAEDMLAFLQLYADHYDITRLIKFNHYVNNIKPCGNGWTIKYQDLENREEKVEEVDAVMICNGHYNTPFVPKIKGIETFKGNVLHSHDYRVPSAFSGQRVLVVGAGPSGMDIAVEICAVTTRVLLSHHMAEKLLSVFPDNLVQKPDVSEIRGSSVIFVDGTEEDVDAVFFCTGYLYSFPFLDPSCGITVKENYVQPLYKHMVNIERPTMCLVGIPFYVCALPMFDLQVRYFVKAIQGHFKLPDKKAMYEATERECAERKTKGITNRQAHLLGPDQVHYFAALSEESGSTNLPLVQTKILEESIPRLFHYAQGFKDDIYTIIDDETFTIETEHYLTKTQCSSVHC